MHAYTTLTGQSVILIKILLCMAATADITGNVGVLLCEDYCTVREAKSQARLKVYTAKSSLILTVVGTSLVMV